MTNVAFLPAGESAVVVEFGRQISPAIHARVHALTQALQAANAPGIVELVPTFRSVLVGYDPLILSYGNVIRLIKKHLRAARTHQAGERRVIEIPVCYGGAFGEDLPDVAEMTGLSEDEVVLRHTQGDYLIYMMGFLPGFAYLGGLDEKIAVPRLPNPRQRIPAGAVGIGGEQTGIYPSASPGGWRLIGQTPLKPYDPNREQPFLYQAGMGIRFVPVDEARYRDIEQQVAQGTYQCKITVAGEVRNGD